MDDSSSLRNEIIILKNELANNEKNLILAAEYGKTLLDEKNNLHAVMEKLIQEHNVKEEASSQEIYSLKRKVDAHQRNLKSLTEEIEYLEKKDIQNADLVKNINKLNGDIVSLNKKVLSLEAENDILKNESKFYQEKSESLQTSLEEVQQYKPPTIIDDGNSDELIELQEQVNTLSEAKIKLEKEVLNLKMELNGAESLVKRKERDLREMKLELENSESRLTSNFNEIERKKEELMELRVEMDQMRMSQTDLKKKGNSLFGELEDNRQELEKRLITVNSMYTTLKKKVRIKDEQISSLKLNLAALLGMTTSSSDLEYQKYLKSSYDAVSYQLNTANKKIRELEKDLRHKSVICSVCEGNAVEKSTSIDYLKLLHTESLSKIESLEKKVHDLMFSNAFNKDRAFELRKKLHQSDRSNEMRRSEIIKLETELGDLRRLTNQDTECEEKNEPRFIAEQLPSEDKKGLNENLDKKSVLTEVQIMMTNEVVQSDGASHSSVSTTEKVGKVDDRLLGESEKENGVQFGNASTNASNTASTNASNIVSTNASNTSSTNASNIVSTNASETASTNASDTASKNATNTTSKNASDTASKNASKKSKCVAFKDCEEVTQNETREKPKKVRKLMEVPHIHIDSTTASQDGDIGGECKVQ